MIPWSRLAAAFSWRGGVTRNHSTVSDQLILGKASLSTKRQRSTRFALTAFVLLCALVSWWEKGVSQLAKSLRNCRSKSQLDIVKQWVDAGMALGNHGFSHLRLLTTPLPKYEEDVIKGRGHHSAVDERAQPYQLYFRHPYTSTGPTREVKAAFESFLREHGYNVAPFTIENSDYIFNQIYSDARRNNDTALMGRLRKTYLEYNDGQFEFIERLSSEMFGREISQILFDSRERHQRRLPGRDVEAIGSPQLSLRKS